MDEADLSLLLRAISFSGRSHHGQMRKDGCTPYFAHPMRVMTLLLTEFEVSDAEMLAAAALHDTIEDTTTDRDDLIAEFGPRVAGFVATLSKDKRLPEDEREEKYFAGLAAAPIEVKLCKLGDTLDNLLDCDSLPKSGRHKAVKKARLLIEMFEPGFPPKWRPALERVKVQAALVEARL